MANRVFKKVHQFYVVSQRQCHYPPTPSAIAGRWLKAAKLVLTSIN